MNVNNHHKARLKTSDKFALYIVGIVGTIYFFGFCVILTIIPLLKPNLTTVVMFISSSFLQLILLPLIMLSQNNQSKHAELRADNTYRLEIKQEKEIEDIHHHLNKIENKLETFIELCNIK